LPLSASGRFDVKEAGAGGVAALAGWYDGASGRAGPGGEVEVRRAEITTCGHSGERQLISRLNSPILHSGWSKRFGGGLAYRRVSAESYFTAPPSLSTSES